MATSWWLFESHYVVRVDVKILVLRPKVCVTMPMLVPGLRISRKNAGEEPGPQSARKKVPGGSKSRGSSLASPMEESAGLALQTGEHFKLPKERLLNF